jgi:hypothetical protein
MDSLTPIFMEASTALSGCAESVEASMDSPDFNIYGGIHRFEWLHNGGIPGFKWQCEMYGGIHRFDWLNLWRHPRIHLTSISMEASTDLGGCVISMDSRSVEVSTDLSSCTISIEASTDWSGHAKSMEASMDCTLSMHCTDPIGTHNDKFQNVFPKYYVN